MTEPEQALSEAAGALSAREEPDWRSVADRAKARAAGITNHFSPVLAYGVAGPFAVSDRVLALLLRREVSTVPGVSADAVAMDQADGPLARIRVDVVAAYGVVLPAAALEVRAAVARVLHRDLGLESDGIPTVDVHFSDLDPVGTPLTSG